LIVADDGTTLGRGRSRQAGDHMAESARRDVDTATVAEVRAILDDYEHREEGETHTDAA
jgi:hypothetical protein